MELFVDIVGWIGFTTLTAAYFLISQNKVTADTYLYQGLNLVGCITLFVNSTYYKAYPSSILNVVWFAIGTHALYKIIKKAQTKEAEDLPS